MAFAFSYKDTRPDTVDRIVRRCFEGWHVQRCRVGPLSAPGIEAYHQGWCAASHVEMLPAIDLQRDWEEWSTGAR